MDATRIIEPGPTLARARPLSLKAIRAGMGLLCTFAPTAASRLAERIWFTPPRPRRSATAGGPPERVRPFTIFPAGRRVAGWTLGEGPAVLLMHGWGGFAGQMLPLAEALAALGLRAVAIDAPAHGTSGPSRLGARRSSFFDFCDGLLEADAVHGPAVAIAAHSGGAVATYLALQAGLPVRRVVLLAPMSRLLHHADDFRDALGLSARVDAAWRASAERRLGFTWKELEVSRPPLPDTPPTLVIHDHDDAEVEFADGAAVAEGWPGARLIDTSGLGHRRLLRDPAVLDAAARFLAEAGGLP